jgi:hypothetical protein
MSIDISQLKRLDSRSVQVNPPADGSLSNYFVVNVAGAADGMIPWGTSPANRDRQLREFYVTEPWLAGTVASLSARNAAFSWTLEGPPRTCDRIQAMLHASNYGGGWVDFITRLSIDLYTQDNGAFVEIIRDGDSPSAAAIGLANLDSSRCQRTGNWETPVVYTDRQGQLHKLQWFQVIDFTDAPSTLETMNGLGFCASSRVLRYSQIMRDIAVYQHERVSGRNPGALYIVSGVSTQAIQDVLRQAAEHSDNKGQARYEIPAVMGTLDPAAAVQLVTILLKSLPDNYDPDNDRKWYIAALALAFGAEYQDLAPLPGTSLGSGAQSQMLHAKAKGKGPELFKKMVTHKLNFYILPQNVQFKFDERDYDALNIEATVRKLRADERAARITSGEITPEVARLIANDDGDLKNEYLDLMATQDTSPEGQVTDEEQENEAAGVPGQPGPTVAPGAAPTPAPGAAPAQPPQAGQVPPELAAKEYDAEAWDRRRLRREKEYEDELTAILEAVQARVIASVKREVSASGA